MQRLARLRFLLALPAVVALAAGVMSGLARLGVPMPDQAAAWVAVHGALMVGGFFGTVIGLERAVAVGHGWTYFAPLASGLSVPALLIAPNSVAPALLVAAALVMTAACASVWRRQHELHLATLTAGSACWLLGNVAWLLDGSITAAVPLWGAFLILTIAGERLELSRVLPTPPAARRAFFAIVAVLMFGALAGAFDPRGMRLEGVALAALGLWLLRYDIARRTIRSQGLTRYMAVCLLSGYAWLVVAGGLGAAGAFLVGEPLRDAALHALLLGFVFAMVFGHAPVIFPALTRLKMQWHCGFYVPLALLHASMLLRFAAGMMDAVALRQWSAAGNAVAIAVFLATVVTSAIATNARASAP